MLPKNLHTLLIAGLVILSASLAGCIDGEDENNEDSDTAKLIFAVTDNITDGFSEIYVTFSEVKVHHAEDGWITVVNETKTVDLLELGITNNIEVLGVADINPGHYSQIRISVDESWGILVDNNNGGREDFFVPSDTLKIIHSFNATAGEERTLTVDFDLDRSIVLTGNGEYIMTPVVGYVDDGDVRDEDVEFENEGVPDENGDNGSGSSDDVNGTVNFAVTDNITLDFSEVYVTFSKVEIHSSDNGEWITIVNDTKTVDLLALGLSGDIDVLGVAHVEAGHYTQIRISVDNASGILSDDGSEVNIMVASGTLRIVRGFNISAGDNRTIVVDFDLERSLHLAGSGRYILTPVIGYVDFNETGADLDTEVPYEMEDYNDNLTDEEREEIPEIPEQ